jgi:hypothetical protein
MNVYYDKCMKINMRCVTFGKHNRDIHARAYTADTVSRYNVTNIKAIVTVLSKLIMNYVFHI